MGWGDKISPAPGTGATGLAGPKWSRGVAVAETCSKLCVKLLACPSLLPLWKELFLGICQQGVLCPSRRVQDHPPPPSVGVHPGAPRSCCPKGVLGGLGMSGQSARTLRPCHCPQPWLCPLCPRLPGSGVGVIFGQCPSLSRAAAAPVTFPGFPSCCRDRDTASECHRGPSQSPQPLLEPPTPQTGAASCS